MTDNIVAMANQLYEVVRGREDVICDPPFELERLAMLVLHGQDTDDVCRRCRQSRPLVGRTACEPCIDIASWERELCE